MTLPANSNADILVVGAGPVGLTLACELIRYHIPCRIIDKAPGPAPQSRALAIFPRTLEIFEQMGVLKPILQAGRKLHSLNIYAKEERVAHLNLKDVASPYPFALCLAQSETEQILLDHLAQAGVEVERPVELVDCWPVDGCVEATLRHKSGAERQETVSVPWLVGCDGAHSVVRQALDIPFLGHAEDEEFVLADVELFWPFSDREIHLFFHEDGPLGVIPLPTDGLFRLVAALPPQQAARMGQTPTLAEAQALLDVRGPAGLTLRHPVWLSRFHVSYRQARTFQRGHVFLAGDAAHIHSPAGGQGMNIGIQDAHNLAWKLALVATGQTPPDLLESYHAERKPVAQDVLRLTETMTEAATLRHPFAQQLRNLALGWLTGVETVEHQLTATLSELTTNYNDSPLIEESWDGLIPHLHQSGPAAGSQAPDGWLWQACPGEPLRLFEVLRQSWYTLLLFEGRDAAAADGPALAAIAQTIQQTHGQFIAPRLIVAGETAPNEVKRGELTMFDKGQMLHQRYGAEKACLYLIRPDGYIGFRGLPPRLEPLQEHLRRIFS